MVRYKDSKYLISSSGLVINEKTGKQLRPQDNGNGYKKITLTINGTQHQKYIHRLVAEYYCLNPDNFSHVNHKDGNKSNNHFSNLEWVSPLINVRHAIKLSLFPRSTDYWNSKLTELQIKKIIKLSNEGMSGISLAKKYKVSRATISEVINGKRHKKIFSYI